MITIIQRVVTTNIYFLCKMIRGKCQKVLNSVVVMGDIIREKNSLTRTFFAFIIDYNWVHCYLHLTKIHVCRFNLILVEHFLILTKVHYHKAPVCG